jgi:hypothetical protein
MIDKKELAVCKKRGHDASLLGGGWEQCKWCGTWLREVRTIEERDDTPPESDRNVLATYRDRFEERKKDKKKKKARP